MEMLQMVSTRFKERRAIKSIGYDMIRDPLRERWPSRRSCKSRCSVRFDDRTAL